MYNWIRTLKTPEDEELFNMSLNIEPRLTEPWPIIQKLLNEKHNHLSEIRHLRAQLHSLRSQQSFSAPATPQPKRNQSNPRNHARPRRQGSDVQIGSIARASVSRQFRSVSQLDNISK